MKRKKRRDIDCHSTDLNARWHFHNGRWQKKSDQCVDRRLFSRIHSPSLDSCRRDLRKVPNDSAADRAERGNKELQTPMEAFADDELANIEREHPQGLSSEEIIGLLTRKGVRFTEATLRKYVQLGLLPRSRRVGMKGKHRGSQGMYPATVVRRVQRLKSMMQSYTIEQIQREFLFVRGDIEELEKVLERIFSALSGGCKVARGVDGSPRVALRELSDARALAAELMAKLTSAETRLTMQARLQREAS